MWHIAHRSPSEKEAAAVAQLLQHISIEMLSHGFQYLIGYEWVVSSPSFGRRVGDMLFTDGKGRLLVVEAKGSSGRAAFEYACWQSTLLAAVLREVYPGCSVYAAAWSPSGWQWVQSPIAEQSVLLIEKDTAVKGKIAPTCVAPVAAGIVAFGVFVVTMLLQPLTGV
jgi:hypothetical protein